MTAGLLLYKSVQLQQSDRNSTPGVGWSLYLVRTGQDGTGQNKSRHRTDVKSEICSSMETYFCLSKVGRVANTAIPSLMMPLARTFT